MAPLSVGERQEFLAQPHVAAFSVSAGEGRGPLTVPIWYAYEPGEDPWIITGRRSRKGRLLDEHGRFCLMVESVQPRVRYVSVEGPAERHPLTEAQLRAMTERYMLPEAVEDYFAAAWEARTELDDAVYVLRPQRWLSADLSDHGGTSGHRVL
ncbi:pyridoxamine 5'-phosphate oxidase [Streptomonospora alba]|uniref:Pyridoxamine 5'-phosphate oxidase n=1 Tax=Streptomonospora alba TaxID=183763 RepID=A0A0C2G641_9ACTN|nr:pyridoxamine 5'-phosphate oxidase family protein [Streptomonospora alba]KIH98768.1 pyridoxamine 5'-phosphate oxidase [Streptomonospora alba]